MPDLLSALRHGPGGTEQGVQKAVPVLDPKVAALRLEEARHAHGLPVGPAAQIATGQKTLQQMAPSGIPAYLAGPQQQQQQQQTVQSLLSAILGGQQGAIPQGYANFFTDVIGPMLQHQQGTFHDQLQQAASQAPQIPGVDKATQDAINKAYGQTGAQLDAMTQALGQASGPGALGLQNFVTGPLANTQKLISSLQAALSYLPYVQATTGASPLTQSVEQMLGLNQATNPAGATAPGTAPALSQ